MTNATGSHESHRRLGERSPPLVCSVKSAEERNGNILFLDFFLTNLELDGIDIGPLKNYMKEMLYGDVEEHVDRGILSNPKRS